ncbi:hypothetical protein RFI_23140 [Reticulomyxa filosa]|uniref:Uncharacterized protein n=1 Tax=Reticulomyxa filosa TaxID=46433 RepID=X6MKQ8_RETFI|nr:hypothetical protein RFI_23140 [Reticulomyxa filosa]|eukprot:ETO14226.1 hypothetical protein RFI_23140 [Reticulomyxa filosa]
MKSNDMIDRLITRYGEHCSKSKLTVSEKVVKRIQETGIGQLNASALKLKDAQILALVETLNHEETIPHLVKIDFSLNCITDTSAKNLAELFVRAAATLTHLNLSGNDISPTGVNSMLFRKKDKISLIHLFGAQLCKCFEHCKKLQYLNLNGNKIGNESAIELSEHLNQIPSLSELDVGNCDIGVQGWTHIMVFLQSHPSIETLNMENARIQVLSDEMSHHCGTLLFCSKSLKYINISKQVSSLYVSVYGIGIGNKGIEWIAHYLRKNNVLYTLDISCNGIGCDGIFSLRRILCRPISVLKHLILNGNRLTDLSSQSIAAIILDNNTLVSLHLANCDLNDNGLCVIGEAVKKKCNNKKAITLQKLFLDGNCFGTKSRALWSQLAKGEQLQSPVIQLDCVSLLQEPF